MKLDQYLSRLFILFIYLFERNLLNKQEYGGHFSRCIEQSGGSAVDLVQLVIQKFPSYRDEAVYDGQRGLFLFHLNIQI
jgi:hypothetical protein